MNPRHLAVVGSLLALCACSGPGAPETTEQSRESRALLGVWIDDPALPLLYNASGASDARAIALTKAALAGLGFSGAEAPNHDDRVFVGKRYLAWIDQTGFYGKMNGLWVLDGAGGDALDFVLKDPDGRPVNTFIPGEDGEGRFAGGYKGAEHVEFPNRVPENNDDPNCAQNDWCNQYGLNEAPAFTNTRIPWWSACNAGSPSFSTKFEPVVLQTLPDGGIKLVYEGPLVKEADGDSVKDGDACHADYLFPDKVRRRVYLRVGYELHPDSNDVDRTMQIVNPAGNPTFAGDMSLIGGFVMTAWPNPNYLKRLNRFWRPEVRETTINWAGEGIRLPGSTWTDMHARPPPASDVVIGWIDQPITFGVTGEYAAGRTATVAHVGPSDNQDVGGCLCAVHGAVEMGGGLIHAGISLPIGGGQSTIEARRRLTVPNALRRDNVRGRTFDVVNGLAHGIGRADPDGWYATTASDAKGHMIYGPYATDWGGGAAQAVFQLKVDNNSADDGVVVTLEFNDATTDTVFASRPIRRREFRSPHTFQRFTLQGNLDGRAGHRLEARVYWHDISYVKVGSAAVHLSDF